MTIKIEGGMHKMDRSNQTKCAEYFLRRGLKKLTEDDSDE